MSRKKMVNRVLLLASIALLVVTTAAHALMVGWFREREDGLREVCVARIDPVTGKVKAVCYVYNSDGPARLELR